MDIFKEEQLERLKTEIETTLQYVREELRKVEAVCDADPAETDTIIRSLNDASTKLTETWDVLEKSFNTMLETLGNIIKNFVDTITRCKESIDEYTKQVHN